MKLVNPIFEKQVCFEENKVNVCIIENQKLFSEQLSYLVQQINGEEGPFIYSDGEKILEISKYMEIIVDPFSVNLNQKKIITKLYSNLKLYLYENEYLTLSEMSSNIFRVIEIIQNEIEFPITYSMEYDLNNIFKLVDLKFEDKNSSVLERIVDYISLLAEFTEIKCLVFVNLKTFMDEEDVIYLYKHCFYQKMSLVDFEAVYKEGTLNSENEILHLIDKDLCEIL